MEIDAVMLTEIILGAIGKEGVRYAGSKAIDLFKSAKAKDEIAEIGSKAIEAGISKAPALADDLRSISFVKGVFVPVLKTLVADPSKLPDPAGLAIEFVAMFVDRFTGDDSADVTLQRIFQTNRSELIAALEGMLTELRSQLYQSKHWRELGHFSATEQTLQNTVTIIDFLDRQKRSSNVASVDLGSARKDAKAGSDELRSWPRDIKGRELVRPELERLKSRIASERSGSTLLIGEAGAGKSALLSQLVQDLEGENTVVFGIKADTLPPTVSTFDDVGRALGMLGPLVPELEGLAQAQPVVLIIDQLDAVSDVMDRSSDRMKVLLRLVRHVRDHSLPVHVIVSSRPFEASHDARFQQLKAEEITLSLPSVEDVLTFLAEFGVESAKISERLRETLRRPFALKLFVDLVTRGVSIEEMTSGALLDLWLATSDLGADPSRLAVHKLMEMLASEMLETETLWRPADIFIAKHKEALAYAEAAGLIVRSGAKIGFSHQSWLDDFQAKSFKTGNDLAEYAWQNQDGLFVRGTVLRALQRLRQTDEVAYSKAINSLLWTAKTRRHLKHLIVEVIGTARPPSKQEGAWVEAMIDHDPILANRALAKVAEQWAAWRDLLSKCLPKLMTDGGFQWIATRLLASEAAIDADNVVNLVRAHWDTQENDRLVFQVIEQSGVITETVEEMVRTIMSRTQIDEYAVSHFVTTLQADRRFREAARIVGIWFGTATAGRDHNPSLHDIQKLAEAAPRELAEELLSGFLKWAAADAEHSRDVLRRYPKSKSLPWDWDFDRDRDKVLEAFRDAVNGFAKSDPDNAKSFLTALAEVEIEQVQEVVAQAYTAAGSALADYAVQFLLADERRLYLGDAHVTLEPGLSSTESGLTSRELVEAIAPHLPDEVVEDLRDRIENWSLYALEFLKEGDPKLRLRRLKWADENRLELLERLPSRFLTPRRRRQVAEWRGAQRRPIVRKRGSPMATMVGAPMSHHAMLKAHDDDVFRMLDELHDASERHSRRRPVAMDGGVVELSREFAQFGKQQPTRAIDLARQRFVAGRHEHAAGALIHKLSDDWEVSADAILALIEELSGRGFASQTWKTHASWTLTRIARKLSGLPDETIALLISWLNNDPEKIAADIIQRLDCDARNAELNKRERGLPEPYLFHAHRLGGMQIVPQDNFSVLDAIFVGLMARAEKGYEQWLSILEGQADKDEDPHIWTFLLGWQSDSLYWADRARVQALLRQLWARDKRIFMSCNIVGVLWQNRAMFPDDLLIEIISSWFEQDDEAFTQAAAEYTQALVLVHPDNLAAQHLRGFLTDQPSPNLTGRLFSIASAWRDGDSKLRADAHDLVMNFVAGVRGDQAHAVSGAVDRRDTLHADDATRELVLAIANNPEVLAASVNGRFADALQSLLLYPDFDEPVMYVTAKIAQQIVDQRGSQRHGYIGREFVQVTIALQRSDGPLKGRAMDVYEKLLDAGAYGAEQAARDVLRQ